jgi:hypothetical protein
MPRSVLVAAVSILAVGGAIIIGAHEFVDDSPPYQAPPGFQIPEIATSARKIPMLDDVFAHNLHSVTVGFENGSEVVKICVVEGGDELVVDLKSGRLLETRSARGNSPPGKLAAPFAPMM